jgi:hypothetical protein
MKSGITRSPNAIVLKYQSDQIDQFQIRRSNISAALSKYTVNKVLWVFSAASAVI